MSGVTVEGRQPDRSPWVYEGIVSSPDTMAARVIHCQWSFNAVRPWIRVSPLQRSTLSAELLAGIERGLKSELTRESKYILPIPAEPNRTDFAEWGRISRRRRAGA